MKTDSPKNVLVLSLALLMTVAAVGTPVASAFETPEAAGFEQGSAFPSFSYPSAAAAEFVQYLYEERKDLGTMLSNLHRYLGQIDRYSSIIEGKGSAESKAARLKPILARAARSLSHHREGGLPASVANAFSSLHREQMNLVRDHQIEKIRQSYSFIAVSNVARASNHALKVMKSLF